MPPFHSVTAVLNVAGYRFVAIDDPSALRERLRSHAAHLGLLGTVLLAGEGINLSLAGSPGDVRGWLAAVRADTRFADLTVKESWSASVPFRRLKVKVKREIVRMDRPTIRPAGGRAQSIEPEDLHRWFAQGHDDDGRHLLLLDSRNAFEVGCGTFEGAVDLNIDKFTEFPERALERRADFVDRRVVSFCTGGIRCEKAAIFLRESGVESVVQLDGGILRYFEEFGTEHFNGSCFVFDERISLAGDLTPV
jgi:UPF0176 protein